jgi:hypothetical protein
VRDVIPLPTWPGRDFLEKLVKIAGAGAAGYSLDTFLAEFPRFLHTKTGATHKSHYFRNEGQRCILCPELDDFYDTVVQPWIISNIGPKIFSRKRRRADVVGRAVNTGAQVDEEPSEVELPRRANPHGRERESTVLGLSPAPQTAGSILRFSESPLRHIDEHSPDRRDQIEENLLDVTLEHSLVDDVLEQQAAADDDDQAGDQVREHQSTAIDYANMAPRKAEELRAVRNRKAQELQAIQDKKAHEEVGTAFALLLTMIEDDTDSHDGDDINSHDDADSHVARWLMNITHQRI